MSKVKKTPMYPFGDGDVVYHPVHGKGVVGNVDNSAFAAAPFFVKWAKSSEGRGWFRRELLSFEPWNLPVYERPFKKGYYVLQTDHLFIAHRESPPMSHIVDYLGEELPKDWKLK